MSTPTYNRLNKDDACSDGRLFRCLQAYPANSRSICSILGKLVCNSAGKDSTN